MELRVFGVGNATRDCEVKNVGKTNLCENSLAFNRSYKVGEEWQEEVSFVKVKVWGAKGEKFASLVSKGTPVFVEGYMAQESWEDKEGQKRSVMVLVVNNFNVCERNGKTKTDEATSKESPQAPKNQKKTKKEEPVAVTASTNSEEIPF